MEKCKDRLSANNEKIQNLTKENELLKTTLKKQEEVIKKFFIKNNFRLKMMKVMFLV